MNDYSEKVVNEEYVTAAEWRVSIDDTIGGWCIVVARDKRTPAEGSIPVANFLTEGIARHIVALHNASI